MSARGGFIASVGALALFAPSGALLAQAARTTAPATIASAADTGTSMYDVGGIRVIHRMAAGEIVVANLYLLGGVRQV
ncbi:MAG: hypothetical protein ABIT38_01720, partial [Gemmatimonadaceae bacterium]